MYFDAQAFFLYKLIKHNNFVVITLNYGKYSFHGNSLTVAAITFLQLNFIFLFIRNFGLIRKQIHETFYFKAFL